MPTAPRSSYYTARRARRRRARRRWIFLFFTLLLAALLLALWKRAEEGQPISNPAQVPSQTSSSSLSSSSPPSSSQQQMSSAPPSLPNLSIEDIASGLTSLHYTPCLILVNDSYPLEKEPEGLVPDNTGEFYMTQETLTAYEKMKRDADGSCPEPLGIISAYRTADQQTYLYANNPYAAPVWKSEHQTGLSLDLRSPDYAGEYFLVSEVGRWVEEHCWDYGFILRYPEERSDLTGIPNEPWHYRYVGLPHSLIIRQKGWVLEEYIQALPTGSLIEWEDGVIAAVEISSEGTVTLPEGSGGAWASPDNTGRLVLWWQT